MCAQGKSWGPYQPQAIESKWQKSWLESGLYLTREGGGRPKFFCMEFFPYPSGDGLHVGHCRNYVPTDVISRYKRMKGFNVLHPMGWDAFGEPTEQFAVLHNVHPRLTTDQNTANFRRQFTILGTSYDWTREIDSSQPEYYRWTQWFFLLLYQRGLAYRDTNWQWWCPTCQTTLSSHEVTDGVCWRGHTGVIRREIPAWYFRITAYADALLEGLERIDWPEKIKSMQRNWIGRSEGTEINFPLLGAGPEGMRVFTTRPDTVFGATFFALAPEHPLVGKLTSPEQRQAVEAYARQAARLSEIERMDESRPKTGVFTGGYVTNPFTGEAIPVWVADYVLGSYGTGAVMGVPAHDERDFEFARHYNLPMKAVILPPGESTPSLESAYTGLGKMVNSAKFDGLDSETGMQRIADALEANGWGKRSVQYRMRDWLISRQRYWGAPIPIIHCPKDGEVPVPEEDLPVLLPEMTDFKPDGSGRSPLARLPDFVNTTCPRCGGPARRETDTMGGFACSSWYFLRYTSPHYNQGPFEPEAMRYWMPVDLYVGGTEHAVLHLLYARFWVKVMHDAGLLPFDEPFSKLLNQGQLMGTDGVRMSKSRGNVITPDSIVETAGSDALRLYEMFMAPFDQDNSWSTEGLNGARRFLAKVWKLYAQTFRASAGSKGEDTALERARHRIIRDVGERIDTLRFNTMVSALMEFTNLLLERQSKQQWHTATFHRCLETLLVVLAPAAPHITEEMWALTGHPGSVHQQAWPAWEAAWAAEESLEVAVQVDGRLRAVLSLAMSTAPDEIKQQALTHPKVAPNLEGKAIKQVIYVPGKIVNIVTEKTAV